MAAGVIEVGFSTSGKDLCKVRPLLSCCRENIYIYILVGGIGRGTHKAMAGPKQATMNVQLVSCALRVCQWLENILLHNEL